MIARHRLRSTLRSIFSFSIIAIIACAQASSRTFAAQIQPMPTRTNQAQVPTRTDRAPLPVRIDRTPIKTKTLSNGLKVVVVEDHAAPVVQTALWYRFGSNYETPGKTGLAHGLEHMMFRGTPSISSGGLDTIGARLGAELNANTANDYTHFYMVMPADRLDLALRIEADRMQHLTLSQEDWNLERGAVLSEYDGDLSQPVTKLYNAVCQAATRAHLCGLSALGDRQDIVRASAADLRNYYDTYYGPNNATLVITGDVQADQAFDAAETAFGALLPTTLPTPTPPTISYATGKVVQVDADYPFAVVDLAYPAPGSLDPGFAGLQIADSVITNQRSAFYQALVVSGLTLEYQTEYDDNLHGGIYHVFLIVSPTHTGAQARAAFEQTLSKTEIRGFPRDLIDAAKVAVTANAVYARDSITGLGDRVGYALGVEGVSDPAVDDEKVQAATSADVLVAAKHFLASPAVIGMLVPHAHKPGESTGPPSGGVSDTFTNRAPSGPIVIAPWARTEMERPITLHSKIDPTRFTLANGMRVLVQEVHTNPTVFISGHIDSSPRFDPPHKEGAAILAASLLSYGSRHYDFTQQRKITDDVAAFLELGQNFEAHGMARNLGLLLALIADSEQNPAFERQYVDLVRRQTLSSIDQRDHNPDYLAGRAFQRLLLPSTDPALRQSSAASISAISISDLRRYVRAYLRPDLTTLSIVGDVTPSVVRAQLETTLGRWSAGGLKPDTSELPIPLPKPASTQILAQRPAVSVQMGQPAPPRTSPDFYTINLMNQILGGGGGFDTRLMNEIRVKRGLVYGVSSTLNLDRYRGTLTFAFSAAPKNVAPAVSVIKEQLRRLQQEPVRESELAQAKSKLVASTLVSEQATDAILAHVENIGTYNLPTTYYQLLDTHYNAITAPEIQRVARAYLFPDHLVEVFEGPRP